MKTKILTLIAILFLFSGLRAQIPTDGLVLNLPLDGTVIDSSSYKNVCTNHGATAVADRTGKAGKAMAFDGYSYISIPSTKSLDLTGNKTLSCWVYVPSNVVLGMYPTLIFKNEPLKQSATYCLHLTDCSCYNSNQHKFGFLTTTNTTHYEVYSKQLYTDNNNKWLHIVCTYDTVSGYSKIYFNGQLSDSIYNEKTISNTSDLDLNIGCSNTSDSRTFFNGYIDDVLLYNRALSATEINQIYTDKFSINAGANKTIVCNGKVSLDSVTTTYKGKGVLKYKWTPATGLNNDTIARPTCTTSNDITYTVTVTTPDGSIATGKVTVSVKQFSPDTYTTEKYITCGQSIQFDSIITNYTGTGALKYKWYPSTGLNSDSVARPTCKPSQDTYYTVTITTPGGCSTTAYVYAYLSSYYPYLYSNKTVSCGDTIKLDAATTNIVDKTNLHYKWTPSAGLNSDTIENPIATLTSDKSYDYTVTTSVGCTVSIGSVYITYTKTAKPVIMGVGVDNNNKNIIFWNKSVYSNIKSFNIYKETNVANSYKKIGTVPYDSISIFTDTLSFPNVQSNRYKLSMLDQCGYETDLSDYHKTMHLSINQGVGSTWNLIWEPYEGFTVSTYNIYRGTKASNIVLIGTLSGSNTQYSDYTAPSGDVYYQIEAVKSSSAAVKTVDKVKSMAESTTYTTRSNIATNAAGSLETVELKDISNSISVFPNPASDKLQLNIAENVSSDMNLVIYNLLGSIVETEKITANKQVISLKDMTNGVYLLVVKSDKFIGSQRLIIQK